MWAHHQNKGLLSKRNLLKGRNGLKLLLGGLKLKVVSVNLVRGSPPSRLSDRMFEMFLFRSSEGLVFPP